MQIPTFAEQNPSKLALFGLELGFGTNAEFLFRPFGLFFSGGYFDSRRYNASWGDYRNIYY
jgi:hypothetical protein